MSKRIDETGNVYNDWTILKYIPPRERINKDLSYLAKCSCGVERPVRIGDLRSGKSKCCGHTNRRNWNIEIGKTYGDITVLRQLTNQHGNLIQKYECKCSCGNQVIFPADLINKKKNCGCKPYEGFDVLQDLIGQKFGYLTVIRISDRIDNKGKRNYRICRCDCGNIIEVYRGHLLDGHTKSCGCLVSFGENYVENFFKQRNIIVKRQYKFQDLKDKNLLPFDIALFNQAEKLLGLIEIQGKQHYDKDLLFYSDNLILHDEMKLKYCIENNIPFLILDYSKGQEKTDFIQWNDMLNNFLEEVNN